MSLVGVSLHDSTEHGAMGTRAQGQTPRFLVLSFGEPPLADRHKQNGHDDAVDGQSGHASDWYE